MTQMTQLMKQMNSIQQQLNIQASTTSTITQSLSSSSHQHRPRTNTFHYCWSHDACAHTSAQCRSKKSGHKDEATFTNKLGGSTVYCNVAMSSTSTWNIRPMMQSNTIKINTIFNTLQSSSIVHNLSHSDHILKGDSGATNHYISPDSSHLLTNLQDNTNIHA